MTDKHTQEPWHTFDNGSWTDIVDDSHRHVVTVEQNCGEPYLAMSDADARRIVACVNACAGISTDVLERENIKHVLERVFWSAPECTCSFGREATSDPNFVCAWCQVERVLGIEDE